MQSVLKVNIQYPTQTCAARRVHIPSPVSPSCACTTHTNKDFQLPSIHPEREGRGEGEGGGGEGGCGRVRCEGEGGVGEAGK